MVITDDRHNNLRLYRRDRLVTGRHVEGDLAEVAVRVHKVGRAQRHVRRAFVGTGRRRYRRILRRLREIVRRVQAVADVRDLVARDRVRLAVVFVCMVITDDRHNHFVRDRRDLQPAVLIGVAIVIIGSIEFVSCGGNREVILRQAHQVTRISIHVGALGLCHFAIIEDSHPRGSIGRPLTVTKLILYGEAGNRLLGAVVGLGIGVANDLYAEQGLPQSVEGMMLRAVTDKVLIGSYGRSAVSTLRVVGDKQCRGGGVRSVLLDVSHPALEDVALAGRCSGNRDGLVDLDVLALGNKTAGVIVVPVDEGQDFLVLLHIDRLDQDRIGILLARVKIGLRNYGLSTFLGDLRIVIVYHERFAGEDHGSSNVLGAVPLLKLPVAEHVIVRVRRRGGWSCDGLSSVHIGVRVRPLVAARANIVYHVDAISADQLAAPLRVEIHLADGRRIGRIDLTI